MGTKVIIVAVNMLFTFLFFNFKIIGQLHFYLREKPEGNSYFKNKFKKMLNVNETFYLYFLYSGI